MLLKNQTKYKRICVTVLFISAVLTILVNLNSYIVNTLGMNIFATINVVRPYISESLTVFDVPRSPDKRIIKKNGQCVLTTTREVYCSGDNSVGQLGDGTTTNRTTPVKFQLPSDEFAKDISFPCVLTVSQKVYCSGYNVDGRLGDGTFVNRSTPVLFSLPAGEYAKKVVYPSCVLTISKKVYCAGGNTQGALGNGTVVNQATPVQFILPAGQHAEDVYFVGANWCVRTTSSNAYCAGSNFAGQLTTGNTANQSTPVKFNLPVGSFVHSIDGFSNTICALTTRSDVYCAGWNGSGELGLGYTSTSNTSAVKLNLPSGEKVTKQMFDGCVLTYSRKVYCRGGQTYGQFGIGNTSDQYTAVQSMILPPGEIVQDIGKPNTYGVCALTVTQKIYCAGHNATGALGNGTYTSALTPTLFIVPSGVIPIEITGGCALSSELKLFCTGINVATPATPAEYIIP